MSLASYFLSLTLIKGAETSTVSSGVASTGPRVLFLAPRIYPFFIGGFEIAYHNLAIQLRKVDVQVLTIGHVSASPSRKAAPCRTYLLRMTSGLVHARSLMSYLVKVVLYAIGCFIICGLTRNSYDLIHAQSISFDVAPLGVALAALFRKRSVLWGRGGDIYAFDKQHALIRGVLRWAVVKADLVLALSEDMKLRVESISGRRDVLVIPNAVRVPQPGGLQRDALFQKLGILKDPAQTKLLLYVGRMTDFKGVNFLLHAMPTVLSRLPNIHLVLIGRGDRLKALKTLSKELDLNSAVTFVGEVPHSQLLDWLPHFGAFVYPELRGQGATNAILEAMASGLPVVASSVGALPEIVIDGETGLLVPAADAGRLAEKIVDLFSNDELRRRMSATAKKVVEERFSWNTVIAKIVAAYSSLL